jgi:methanogenic corrinoid protein MtbC1
MGDEFDHQLSVTESRAAQGRSPAFRQSPFVLFPRKLRDTMSASAMVRTLRSKILSRIAQAFRPASGTAAIAPAPAEDVARLVQLVLSEDDTPALALVEQWRASGAGVDATLLQLLAPAARQLGDMWEADTIDFGSVTVGVSRLQRLLHHCTALDCTRLDCTRPAPEAADASGAGAALLTTLPGEQHSFGLLMAAEYFRRGGWHLHLGPLATSEELRALVQNHWFDIVGFSVCSDRRLAQLASDIALVRRHSQNRQVGVILGGRLVGDHPGLAAAVGADMVSRDVTFAARHASALLETLKGGA